MNHDKFHMEVRFGQPFDNINVLVQPSMWGVDRNCVIDMSLIAHHLIEKYYDDVVSAD